MFRGEDRNKSKELTDRNRSRNLKTSKALYSKAKRTRAPVYSRALRRIKVGSQRGSREAQVQFPEYQERAE